MTTYEIKKGRIYLEDKCVPVKTILDRLVILDDIEKICTKHNIKELGGNLRFLADYFDDKDNQKDIKDGTEVQDALNKSANIFGFLSQKISKNEK